MVVAVVAVRMMEMTVDEIIDVIAVRHRFMAASRTVNMARLMAAAVSGTYIWIGRAHFEPVFVHMITVRVMQVAVVQIVDMIAMRDRGVPAVRTVLMIMMGVVGFVARAHGCAPRLACQRVHDLRLCGRTATGKPALGVGTPSLCTAQLTPTPPFHAS